MAYGRTALVERVARSEVSVLLVTGDSGIGKSTVLQLSCALRDGWVSVGPHTLVHSPGALYTGFLDQLGGALSDLAARGVGIPTIGERLAETGRRLGNEYVSVLARVALAELVAVVRGRLGDDVGKAVAEYAKDLLPDTAETLAAKAAQSRDPLAGEVLCAYAEATAELAEGTRVALAFDQGQRLSEDDWRLLGDLAEHLASGVHLRVAFATDTTDRSVAVTRLRADVARVDIVEVPPLDEGAVREWVIAEELSDSLAGPVARHTGGYPLLVEAAILHLKGGGALVEMPRHEQLAARTRASWQGLSPLAASVARKLAVLPDPLSDADLRQLAGVSDVGMWATVTAELQQARILSVDVHGQPWFHTERRAFVLDECLTSVQRDEAASAAAAYLWSTDFAPTDLGAVDLFTRLVDLSPSYQSQEPHLFAAARLDGPALAAAAALLELAVAGSLGAEADSLLSHALSFVDEISDPAEVVAQLEAAGLAVTASNDWATAVAADWGPKTQTVIQGRGGLRLRRPPVPGLAEAVFQLVVRDRLGEFESAQFGIGGPSIGELGRMAAGARPSAGYVNRREVGASVLLRGSTIDGIPLYCAAYYGSDLTTRDHAEEALRGTAIATALGEVAIEEVVRHPLAPVPANRFAAALARGQRHRISPRRTGGGGPPAPEAMSDEELAEIRVRTAQLLFDLADPIERTAMDLTRGFYLAWDSDTDLWDECVVSGAGFGHRRVSALTEAVIHDRYVGVRLLQAIGLDAGQFVQRRSISGGKNSRDDPIAAEINYRASQARIFNSAQPRLEVVLSREHLEPLLRAAFERELSDARLLAERLPVRTGEAVGPRALWLLIALDEPHPGWVAGARGTAIYGEGPSPDGRDQLFVEVIQGESREHGVYSVADGTFEEVFPEAARESWTHSMIGSAIARLLCHHADDIQLVYPT